MIIYVPAGNGRRNIVSQLRHGGLHIAYGVVNERGQGVVDDEGHGAVVKVQRDSVGVAGGVQRIQGCDVLVSLMRVERERGGKGEGGGARPGGGRARREH